MVTQLDRIREKEEKFKVLKFGTSGLRDKIENMTDMECYINARGFIKFLKDPNVRELKTSGEIAVGGDLRKSTPRIIRAVLKAIEDEGYTPEFSGFIQGSDRRHEAASDRGCGYSGPVPLPGGYGRPAAQPACVVCQAARAQA